ncbi:hypothetical protein EHS13_18195 [Paenibacillus psychroresistens]|uniref:Uncharacterized protein n=1 Tax=Paenibacillus psychroresistens TaxID=1778678 RepID=A0A6B8RK68_9BACL|nr:hypothetical protein [Paenibacillus psychroresistens]QGQ96670.1 hypothetical protein EHS13_18195 [Paenibacillus psychroresistens]
MLVLNCFIQITLAQIALQTAVSETTKQIATHMYPVKLLYMEAESKITDSKPGIIIQRVLEQITEARSKLTDSEDIMEQYASYIPQPIVTLLELEKKHRELLESNSKEMSQQLFDPLVNKAFTALVLQFSDNQILHSDHLQVVDVRLPNLASSSSDAFIAIEAQYDYKLMIPFFHRTLSLRKRAIERLWIGS